ncbi:MAG TPA: hypothetical protein PKM65_15675 [Spirochaetota bacterium]|nr:hypothetical protein [Spirochaetota bacterium]HNT11908.1 hypothetical protein [Spirochaetota bacterium]HNV48495.1 hypothetical protein [Spirochaetota bacterium]HOS39238.1 hypothetical protein [Spirochaetota bacterium]HPI23871.1 hypothetical protein [Spirochaetota bacterium]
MKPGTAITSVVTAIIIAVFSVVCLAPIDAHAQQKKDDKDKTAEVKDDKMGWKTRDYRPYIKAFDDLQKLSMEFAEKNLQLAINEYDKGMDALDDMENEVAKIESKEGKKKNLNERWHWQEIDRKNQTKRYIGRIKYSAKVKSVTNFTRAINLIDTIENSNKKFITENKNYKIFKIKLFQVYVSTQYDLQNFKPCIPVLERYLSIDENTKTDIWAYRYLASCYGFMENVLAKYKKATEDEIIDYKQKKNTSLLKAAELKYTVESPQYKHLKDIVERDEMKSESLNDFR